MTPRVAATCLVYILFLSTCYACPFVNLDVALGLICFSLRLRSTSAASRQYNLSGPMYVSVVVLLDYFDPQSTLKNARLN